MAEIIESKQWAAKDEWGQDEAFLAEEIWPSYKHSWTDHGKVLPFKVTNADPKAFCGEVMNPDGSGNPKQRSLRK